MNTEKPTKSLIGAADQVLQVTRSGGIKGGELADIFAGRHLGKSFLAQPPVEVLRRALKDTERWLEIEERRHRRANPGVDRIEAAARLARIKLYRSDLQREIDRHPDYQGPKLHRNANGGP